MVDSKTFCDFLDRMLDPECNVYERLGGSVCIAPPKINSPLNIRDIFSSWGLNLAHDTIQGKSTDAADSRFRIIMSYEMMPLCLQNKNML